MKLQACQSLLSHKKNNINKKETDLQLYQKKDSSSRAINKFGTGALTRKFNYLTEHLNLADHGKYMPVRSLKIK